MKNDLNIFLVIQNEIDYIKEDPDYYDVLYTVTGLFRYGGTYVFEERTFYVVSSEDDIDGVEDSVREIICNEENTSWVLVQHSIEVVSQRKIA